MEYNCCTNGKLPDMGKFDSLEVNAVYPHENETGETHCEPLFGVASKKVEPKDLLSDEDPTKLFFTVYGRNADGEAEALHDEPTLEEIMAVANDLSKRFSLEAIVI